MFVIATEGKTEKQYFEGLADHYRSPRIHVHVLATENGGSSPEFVRERISNYREKYQIEPDDEFWLVIDVDQWGTEKLNEVCQDAPNDFQTAVSNPCFEFWLYLHFSDFDVTDAEWQTSLSRKNQVYSQAMKALLKACLVSQTGRGYQEARLNPERFYPHIPVAIERARALDTNPTERWPATFPGTHVYRLVEKLRQFLPLDSVV